MTDALRDGETVLAFDPATRADAGVTFIGRLETPWQPGDCPKNLTEARARGGVFALRLDADYVPALAGLQPGDAVVVLYWLGQGRRDLLVQAPGHHPDPRGTFALRSPRRPNPIGLAVVRVLSIAGEWVQVDALDAFDGTPLLDIKPWLPRVDIPPDLVEPATNAAGVRPG